MTTNRERVDNTIIKQPPLLLERGLLPGFQGKHVVDEGWVAVVTEGGAYRETLGPGHHSLGRFRYRRDLKVTNVNTKIQTLSVITSDEFKIQQGVANQMPMVIDVDLNLSVEYRVSDARRVAMEIERPVTALFDRVIQAARDAVSYLTINEVRTGGGAIARTIQQNLQGMQLVKTIGMEVFSTFVTSIQATDSGQDALAQTAYANFQELNDWQLQSHMTQNSQVSWEWLVINRPELAQQYIAQYGDLAKTMLEKGMLGAAGFLNAPAGSSAGNPIAGGLSNLLGNMPGMPTTPGALGQLTSGSGSAPGKDLLSRMREEREHLAKLPGAQVQLRALEDDRGEPDGSYSIGLVLPRTSGGQIEMRFVCSPRYPAERPGVDVLVNDQPTPIQSPTWQGWREGMYLIEVARDIQRYVG